jgi:hypothetical protein
VQESALSLLSLLSLFFSLCHCLFRFFKLLFIRYLRSFSRGFARIGAESVQESARTI